MECPQSTESNGPMGRGTGSATNARAFNIES
jgi:hypothetical protein